MRPRWLLALPAIIGIGMLGLALMMGSVVSGSPEPSTTVSGGCTDSPAPIGLKSAAGLDAEQLANASTIISVGQKMGVPAQGWVIALATARQELELRNLPYGDRDSLGLFQQRPSQGWGTPAQVMDPVYSSGKFYSRMLEVPDWLARPVTAVAQAVQRSAFPNAYAQWEPMARQLVASISGTPAPATECAVGTTVAYHGGAAPAIDAAIRFGLAQLGKPYVWGATGPDSFDCSGFVQAAFAAAGVALPRDTYGQVNVGQPVTQDQLQPGDLVLPDAGHIQIYLGGGQVIHAPHTGDVVKLSPMYGFWQARRIA